MPYNHVHSSLWCQMRNGLALIMGTGVCHNDPMHGREARQT